MLLLPGEKMAHGKQLDPCLARVKHSVDVSYCSCPYIISPAFSVICTQTHTKKSSHQPDIHLIPSNVDYHKERNSSRAPPWRIPEGENGLHNSGFLCSPWQIIQGDGESRPFTGLTLTSQSPIHPWPHPSVFMERPLRQRWD